MTVILQYTYIHNSSIYDLVQDDTRIYENYYTYCCWPTTGFVGSDNGWCAHAGISFLGVFNITMAILLRFVIRHNQKFPFFQSPLLLAIIIT